MLSVSASIFLRRRLGRGGDVSSSAGLLSRELDLLALVLSSCAFLFFTGLGLILTSLSPRGSLGGDVGAASFLGAGEPEAVVAEPADPDRRFGRTRSLALAAAAAFALLCCVTNLRSISVSESSWSERRFSSPSSISIVIVMVASSS